MSRVSFALAVAAVVAATSSSVAADMYSGNRAPAAYNNSGYQGAPSGSPWNGAYVGGQAGYGWGSHGLNGGQIGIYGGVNSMVGSNVMVGGEADLNVSGQTASRVTNGTLNEHKSDWNGSVRARVGVVMDKFMPYATAGIALADDTVKAGGTSSTTKVGYIIGGGVEAQVVDHVTAKGELLYSGFGSSNHSIGGISTGTRTDTTVLRGGAAYHF